MHLLPTNLGPLADIADDVTARFALKAVRLRVRADNTFVAEATDTKVLLQLTGPCVAPATDFPDGVPGFDAAANGKTAALVPADAWKKTFAAAKKLTAGAFPRTLRAVAVKVGDQATTLAATNGTTHQCETVTNTEGKFPPTDDILKRDGTDAALRARFSVDPLLLANLLKAIAATCCDKDTMRVDFEVRQPNRPIFIRAGRKDGTQADAIIMPLTDDYDPKNDPLDPKTRQQTAEAEPPAEVIRLEKRLGIVTAERDEHKDVAEERTAQLIDARAKIEQLRAELTHLRDVVASREDRIAELTRPGACAQPPTSTTPIRPLTRAERLAALKTEVRS